MTKTQLVLVIAFARSDLLFICLVAFRPLTPLGQIVQLFYVFLTIQTKLNKIIICFNKISSITERFTWCVQLVAQLVFTCDIQLKLFIWRQFRICVDFASKLEAFFKTLFGKCVCLNQFPFACFVLSLTWLGIARLPFLIATNAVLAITNAFAHLKAFATAFRALSPSTPSKPLILSFAHARIEHFLSARFLFLIVANTQSTIVLWRRICASTSSSSYTMRRITCWPSRPFSPRTVHLTIGYFDWQIVVARFPTVSRLWRVAYTRSTQTLLARLAQTWFPFAPLREPTVNFKLVHFISFNWNEWINS